ncbi:hypothetical protein JZ751_020653 [Albula glossodonta]|uniref:ubiquitinyl hydrolase 1 n=1 Tax=Albula glossodonta TaxID=121402 RepID=A0A8T2PJ63_9TELE|nr:hypothetical protein JZ751_020653 [Albula glossodonta]
MAVDTWAVVVTDSQWAPEECLLGQPVSVTTDRDSLCAPNLFRSWRVRPFIRNKSGPTGPHHKQPAKGLFEELLGKKVIDDLCKRVNSCPVESNPSHSLDGDKQGALQGSHLMAWMAVALQGGLIPGDGNRKDAGMVATVEKWRERYEKSLSQNALLTLNGHEEKVLQKGSKSPVMEQVLHRLLKPYYNKGYHVQLDSSAHMEGRLSQKHGDSGTEEDPTAFLRAHLQGWVGPVLLPWPLDTSKYEAAMFLQGFWLVVHLSCIDAFLLHSLRSREQGNRIGLCDFTNEDGNSKRRASMVQCPGLCGLVNCGNSCYMNAVLQCLLCTVPLVEHFLDRRNRSEISRLQSLLVAGPFLKLVEEVWLIQRESWTPSEMKDVVCTLHPQFDNSCQQDAQELLLFILNALHDDLKKREDWQMVRETPCLQEGQKSPSWPDEASVITRLFQGQLSYVTLCMNCSHQIQQNQVFNMLSLPVPNHVIKCSLQNHIGNLDMGHYTACCHNAHTRSWHIFDDAVVSEVQDRLVQSLGAYILLYSREKFRRPRILGP